MMNETLSLNSKFSHDLCVQSMPFGYINIKPEQARTGKEVLINTE